MYGGGGNDWGGVGNALVWFLIRLIIVCVIQSKASAVLCVLSPAEEAGA